MNSDDRARASASATVNPAKGSLGQSIGAQLEFPPGGCQARFSAGHSQRLFELECLRLQVDLQDTGATIVQR
jgi:hypothetical protein